MRQLMLSLLMLMLAGCTSAPFARLPVTAEDNTARLIQHPQFRPAAAKAPEFVKECFAVIVRLETEKANAGVP